MQSYLLIQGPPSMRAPHAKIYQTTKRKKYIYVFIRCQYQLILTTNEINLLLTRFHWIPKDNDNIETKKHHLQYD